MEAMGFRKWSLPVLVIALVAACGLTIAACGGSDDSGSTASATTEGAEQTEAGGGGEAGVAMVDVGNGKTIPLNADEIKLAYISAGLNVPLGVRSKETLEELTAENGITMETFDAQLDPTRQNQLYETVINSGDYNAIITFPLAGEQACNILTKTAPEKEIVVATQGNAICGREFEPPTGDGLWAPGTLVTSGISTTLQAIEAWAAACEEETGGGETIILNGASGTPNNVAFTKGIENGSGVDVVTNYATNYTPEDAIAKVSAALLAHPDLKVIMATYPPLIEGARQALKSAGKQPGKDVKLCVYSGGNEAMMNLIRSGELAVDTYANYAWTTKNAFEVLVNAAEGKTEPRVISPSASGGIEKAGETPWPPVYTKANVDELEPNGE